MCIFSLHAIMLFNTKDSQTNQQPPWSKYKMSIRTIDLEKVGGDKGVAYPTSDISWKLPKHVL